MVYPTRLNVLLAGSLTSSPAHSPARSLTRKIELRMLCEHAGSLSADAGVQAACEGVHDGCSRVQVVRHCTGCKQGTQGNHILDDLTQGRQVCIAIKSCCWCDCLLVDI